MGQILKTLLVYDSRRLAGTRASFTGMVGPKTECYNINERQLLSEACLCCVGGGGGGGESIHSANSQLAVAIRGASIPSSVQVADRHLGLWMMGGTNSWLALYLFWHL